MTTSIRVVENVIAVAEARTLFLAWEGDAMVRSRTRVGPDEESCQSEGAPTLEQVWGAKFVSPMAERLFGRTGDGEPGIQNSAKDPVWQQLASFLEVRELHLLMPGGEHKTFAPIV